MTTLKLQSTASALAERIREEILSGTFAAGDALPQEELSARYGLSRSPLREALRQLESEGWIIYHPNRGAFVATVSAQDVRELYQVRRILEAGALRLALPTIDKRRLDEVRGVDMAMRKTADWREAVRLHLQFHRILHATGNPRLQEAIERNHVRVPRLPNAERRIKAVVRCSRVDHAALLEACERQDESAVLRAAVVHLDHIEVILLDGLV